MENDFFPYNKGRKEFFRRRPNWISIHDAQNDKKVLCKMSKLMGGGLSRAVIQIRAVKKKVFVERQLNWSFENDHLFV